MLAVTLLDVLHLLGSENESELALGVELFIKSPHNHLLGPVPDQMAEDKGDLLFRVSTAAAHVE